MINSPLTVPQVVLKTRVRDESMDGPNPYRWQDVSSDELFAGKKVVVFALPGAFTMFQCGNHQGVKRVKLLPDGNGEFSRLMGKLVRKDNLGFGERSWRYSMLVEDGQITALFSEPGKSDNCPTDPFEVSYVDTMLNHLQSQTN